MSLNCTKFYPNRNPFFMREFDYIIVCRSPDFKNVDRISQFMLMISLVAFGYSIYLGLFPKPALIFAIMTAFTSWWIFCVFQAKRGVLPYYRLGLLLASWGWFLQPNGLIIAGIFLIGALFERQVKFPYEIAFDQASIVINTFPKKHFPIHFNFSIEISSSSSAIARSMTISRLLEFKIPLCSRNIIRLRHSRSSFSIS